jgi:hypothetical protein
MSASPCSKRSRPSAWLCSRGDGGARGRRHALHEERIATLHDAELSAQRLIDYTLNQRIELIINHVLWRVFLGLVLLILLAFGAGLVLVTFARRSGRLVRT